MAQADNVAVKSKRDMMMERLQQRYPDKDFSDDENIFGQISDDYDDYDKNIQGYQEREKTFSDTFTKDPRAAAFFMAMKDGEHPLTSFIRRYGKDALEEMVENEEKLEEFAKAEDEYQARVAKEAELTEQSRQNMAESLQAIEQLQAAEGISDEDIDAALHLLVTIGDDAIVGKFTTENIKMALKALNHDSDVSTAAQEAEVRGKNTKIEETLRKPSQGDGTAPLGGTSGGGSKPKRSMNIFDYAEAAR